MALGIFIGRRVRGTGDFFVAGRRLGPGLLFSTLVAANIGAGSTVGAAGLGYRDGISAWWWVGSAGLGSLLLAFCVGPRIWRIAARHDLRTLGDYLEHRYSRGVRGTVSALLWVGTLSILAGQLAAMVTVFDVLLGWSRAVSCAVAGIVVVVYFAAGGLLSSAWVNVLQLIVLLGGFLVALPFAWSAGGGWTEMATRLPSEPSYWSFWQGGGSGWLLFFMLGPSFVISPGLLQKVYGGRDERTVRIGVAWNAVALIAFACLPVVFGLIARGFFPSLEHQDLALPMVLRDAVPPVVGSLGLVALLSAELSTADAILFMLATSLSQDLYRRFLRPAAVDAEVLRVARLAAVAGTILSVALAIFASSVADALSIFYTLLTVSLFVPVIAGLYVPSAGATEALAAVAGGVGGVVLLQLVVPEMPSLRGLQAVVGLLTSATSAVVAHTACRILVRPQTRTID
jgi:SSS family solute:Na+ symporter